MDKLGDGGNWERDPPGGCQGGIVTGQVGRRTTSPVAWER